MDSVKIEKITEQGHLFRNAVDQFFYYISERIV